MAAARNASAAPVRDGMQKSGIDPPQPPRFAPGGVKRDAKISSASCMVVRVLYQNVIAPCISNSHAKKSLEAGMREEFML